jgi:hypothetical protein
MTRKSQLLTSVIVLGIIDAVIPLFPILAIILIYVLMEKPPWFLEAVQEIYRTK